MPRLSSPYDPYQCPSDLKFIKYEKKSHVAYVTINRPEVRNALHTYSHIELQRCWRDIGLDPSIYVAILTGEGHAFCAGRDVKFLAKHQDQGIRTPHENPNSNLFQKHGGGSQPKDVELDKPVIAALNGFAVGVGLSLFLQCQLRVMADDAWIGDQHTAVGRVGNPHGIYANLPRATAAFLTLCNGRLGAQECLQQGIVNKVVPRGNLLQAAEELAAMVCRGSPLANQAVVRLYRMAAEHPPALAGYARHLDQTISEGEDGMEGPRAFIERRPPVWQMR